MDELKKHFGLDYSRLSRMSIVEEGAVKVPFISGKQFHNTKCIENIFTIQYFVTKVKI